MSSKSVKAFIKVVLERMPTDWIRLTTHRLDIYKEEQAKVEFLAEFEKLFNSNLADELSCEKLTEKLKSLPTAFDYIRLGHPLSCVLEWVIAKSNHVSKEENIISFSSQVMPLMAILRKNLLENRRTRILYRDELPTCFNKDVLKDVYGFSFDLLKVEDTQVIDDLRSFEGSTVLLDNFKSVLSVNLNNQIDFLISIHPEFGSVTFVNMEDGSEYISEIQHVRRRESIAMTPKDCLLILKELTDDFSINNSSKDSVESKRHNELVLSAIRNSTNTSGIPSVGSSGLSIQYAIMMGLIHHSIDQHKGKDIKFIVPPNCYGGTNDQARRVAACLSNVEVLDLPVDGGQDMVQSIERVLEEVALINAVPFIIAEIPTNPRVEVPDLDSLKSVLGKSRKNQEGEDAIAPVFILDQTFCPNVHFLGEGDFLSSVKTISYVSGSKFPSGGLCTAGYCVANSMAEEFMSYIDSHLKLCNNEATNFQIEILSKQMPSMNNRIEDAYKNTREFVDYIQNSLPEAKINFVSEKLANAGFTPSVFSLDLPTKGSTLEEKEFYKRDLNLKLINMMIQEIPNESKYCVSYGQLQGCYWTIPATSTQGTTKEGDKDYIVRVAVSPDFDLDLHKKVFTKFCNDHITNQ